MTIVNFAEGILGIDSESGKLVAKCIREYVGDEISMQSLTMISAADTLESGERLDIEVIRGFGETHLTQLKKRFLKQ